MRSAQASYRSPSKNGSVAPRQRAATRSRTAPQQEVAPRPRRKPTRKKAKAPLPNGLSVMALLVATLAAIGGMLVVSLNWQRNAHSLAQEEVALRSSLDHVADERQHLLVAEQRASNPSFTSARAADAGLREIKLDEGSAVVKSAVKVTKPVATTRSVLSSVNGKNANGGVGQVPNLTHTSEIARAVRQVGNLPHSALAVAPKAVKPAVIAATTKPASTTTVAKAPQPITQKTERTAIPAMPPSIAKTASAKAALAR